LLLVCLTHVRLDCDEERVGQPTTAVCRRVLLSDEKLYQTLNPLFVASYRKETGQHLAIEHSHGGSYRQARKIITGEQRADVVTLGAFSDVDALRKRGLSAFGWSDRLPNHLPALHADNRVRGAEAEFVRDQ
jgi:sulfate transport system substrate-binding protein